MVKVWSTAVERGRKKYLGIRESIAGVAVEESEASSKPDSLGVVRNWGHDQMTWVWALVSGGTEW